MLHFLLRMVFALIIIFVLAGLIRTYMVEHRPALDTFRTGTKPDPHPVGFYRGKVPVVVTKWQGKTFNDETNTGNNTFKQTNGILEERHPFRTYYGKAVGFSEIEVLKIDYNIPGNPWWLRLITDEIVELAPNQYIGKMHLHILPFFPFTLEHFTLQK